MPRKKDNLSPIRSGDDSDSPRRKSRKTDKAKAEDVQNTRKDLSTFGSTIVAQHRTRFEAEDIHLAQLNNIERNTRIFANAVLERDGKERLPTPPPLPESSSRGRKRYRERLNSNDKLASLIMPSPIITQPLGSPGAPPFVPPTQRVRSDAGTEKKGKGDNAEKGKKAPASGKEGSTNEASVDAREESAERSNDKSDLSAADQNNETIDETSNKTKGKMAAKKSKMTTAMAAGDNKFFDEIMQEVEDIMRSIEEDVELPSEFTDTFYPKYKASVSNGETKLDESFESDLKDLDDQDRDKYVFEALTAFISHKYQVRKGRKGELVTQMTLDDWISEDASQMTRFLHSKDLEFTTLRDDGPTGLYAKLREFKKAFIRRNNVPFVQSIWY